MKPEPSGGGYQFLEELHEDKNGSKETGVEGALASGSSGACGRETGSQMEKRAMEPHVASKGVRESCEVFWGNVCSRWRHCN